MKKTLSAAAAALALLGAGMGTAQAAPAPSGRLFLTVSGVHGNPGHQALLRCPSGAGHPHGREACRQLARTGGQIDALSVSRPCSREYAPVTAEATGVHQGRLVTWTGTYANTCALHAATGHLFHF